VFDVVLSDLAKSDLRENVKWWSEHRSPEEAERWYNAILNKIYSLEHMPNRCPMAPETDALKLEIRHLLFGLASRLTHRVLFEIDGKTINVFRVLHTSQTVIRDADDLA
jgi:plasmid stabilization system protein ParE